MNECHVLLAEDNPMNQELGRTMIEAFGGRVDVASNGYEVLDQVKSTNYDIILMDCQMPIMDGLEATRLVRELEKQQEGHRAVIVALTAHGTDEDRRRCLAAGMDDHLGKPFRMQDLFQILEKWCGGLSPRGAAAGASEGLLSNLAPSENDVANYLDRNALDNIRSLGPDGPGMLSAIIDIYLNDSPILLDRLSEAFDAGDADGVAVAAHALKSTSAGLGAGAFSVMCKRAEGIALGNSLEGLETLIRGIRSEYEKVKEALKGEIQEGC
ncbi:MAG TPA: response regulator [Syntrophobacteraceae bacterium]|nr:response regulator [Syntrophobacteraceae bacterium]